MKSLLQIDSWQYIELQIDSWNISEIVEPKAAKGLFIHSNVSCHQYFILKTAVWKTFTNSKAIWPLTEQIGLLTLKEIELKLLNPVYKFNCESPNSDKWKGYL